jgi:hypothetical protein
MSRRVVARSHDVAVFGDLRIARSGSLIRGQRILETSHGFAETPSGGRKALGTEDKQSNHEHEREVGGRKDVSDHQSSPCVRGFVAPRTVLGRPAARPDYLRAHERHGLGLHWICDCPSVKDLS